MIPIMAVGFELGVEVTYPIDESYSTGLLMFAGQFLGIIYVNKTLLYHRTIDRGELSTDLSLQGAAGLRDQRSYIRGLAHCCPGLVILCDGGLEKAEHGELEETYKDECFDR